VGRALATGTPLIVEAGTGTGKTFAYLVPALLSGRSVIISTGTRTLQDQLFRRDVPLLARALGLPVKIALLKGRANYLCRHRLELDGSRAPCWAASAARRACWRGYRVGRRPPSGDLAELTDLPEQSSVWPMITSTRENCLGQECPQFSRCHVFEARRAAQAAEIVVVNHHLLLADLALKDEGFGDLLPGAEAVILDEAHQVPDIAAQFFGQTWSVRQVHILLRDVVAEMAAAAARAPNITGEMAIVEARLDDLRGSFPAAPGAMSGPTCRSHFWTYCRISKRPRRFGQGARGLGAGAGTANCARRAAGLAKGSIR
jgi:ATP-dependent DNA helicase DinG